MTWDMTEKNKIRRSVCKKGKAPYKSVLMMPGESCLDLKLLVNKGAIDKKTKLHLVERDGATATVITTHLQRMKLTNFVIHQEDLHNIEFPANTKFDFVYLDTCGQLNEHIINWLSKQVQLGIFEAGARVSLAFSQWFRGGAKLYTDYCKFLKKEGTAIARVNPVIKGQEETTEYQDDTHKVMGTLLRSLFGEIEESWLYKNSNKAIPMHVFTFKGRTTNSGLTSIIKFLYSSTNYEPTLISPGIKAAAKRFSISKDKPEPIKEKPYTHRAIYKTEYEETNRKLVAQIDHLNVLIKEMDRRLTNISKTNLSLNGKIQHLEHRLKKQDVIPFPWGDDLVPPITEQELSYVIEF